MVLWIFVSVLFFVLGLVLLFGAFQSYYLKNMVRDSPTENIGSASMGVSELNGDVRSLDGSSLTHPLTSEDCVGYVVRVRARERHSSINVKQSEEFCDFVIADDTGEIRVSSDDVFFEPKTPYLSSETEEEIGKNYITERLYSDEHFDLSFHNKIIDKYARFRNSLIGKEHYYDMRIASVFPEDSVYVMGSLKKDENGNRYIGKSYSGLPVIVSNYGCEDKLARKLRNKSIAFVIGGLICLSIFAFIFLVNVL